MPKKRNSGAGYKLAPISDRGAGGVWSGRNAQSAAGHDNPSVPRKS